MGFAAKVAGSQAAIYGGAPPAGYTGGPPAPPPSLQPGQQAGQQQYQAPSGSTQPPGQQYAQGPPGSQVSKLFAPGDPLRLMSWPPSSHV
ncbi:hypothetical protein VTN02DRAFT_1418 [Thermoascus thermophilus]